MRSFLFLSLMGLISSVARAAVSPLAVSVVAPVQFPGESYTVVGARLNAIYGAHYRVYGFDIGLANRTLQKMVGVQVGALLNSNQGMTDAVGLQLGGIGNWNQNKARIWGVQAAGLMNSNSAESFVLGLAVAAVNSSSHTQIVGVQAGVYNHAREVFGFQVGVINRVDQLHGFQIGLLNYHSRGLVSVSPGLNFGF